MSPSQQYNSKKEIISSTTNNGLLPPPLKINKDSHLIKKSSSSSSPPSSSSSSSSTSSSLLVNSMAASNKPQQQHRHPVIIYTHSPKVIHTHPKDFMALVQKLTGLNHTEDDGKCNNSSSLQPKQEPSNEISGDKEIERKKGILNRNEDSDSSVITEENNCSSNIGENQVNSCFMGAEPVLLEPPMNPYVTNFSNEFMCSNQPLLNYSDSLFFSSNTAVSVPSSVALEAMKEYRDY